MTNTLFTEDQLLPISALQHLLFCERQCALIHVEQQWAENVLTIEGALMHQRVDQDGPRLESRGPIKIARGLALRSLALGLVGIADAVELHNDPYGVRFPGLDRHWRLMPVEHKRGKPKRDDSDRVQVCAQALCLEEMLGIEIWQGALFYGRQRRRVAVEIDSQLRRTTRDASRRLHELVASRLTPLARREPKCRRCSLVDICLPDIQSRGSIAEYLDDLATDCVSGDSAA